MTVRSTSALQAPAPFTVAVPISVVPARMCTTVPASTVPTVPEMVCARALVAPPAVPMTSAGAMLSSV